jgi:CDP-glucose 4,6-dehydratase
MDATWWKSRKVFVTGHTGFKGAWLCLLLEQLGARVRGYSLQPPTRPNLYSLAGLNERISGTEGDVRDLSRLSAALREAAPEIVIHMAAQPLVRQSYQDPVNTFGTNVMGTVNLLEAVRSAGNVAAVVVVTTDKCYENREWVWGYREDEPMGGHDPYSSSKACAELVTSAYRRSFFHESSIAVASARAGNVIGGGDWARDRLIPDVINAFSKGRPVVIRNPESIRPWQFVLEPLVGYLTLAERLCERGQEFAEGWNFGPTEDDAKPVRWIVDRMAQSWGPEARCEIDGATHPHEAYALRLDTSKARTRLGWRPRLGIGAALEQVANWYKRQTTGEDAEQLCREQIEPYCNIEGRLTSEGDTNADIVTLPLTPAREHREGSNVNSAEPTTRPLRRAG